MGCNLLPGAEGGSNNGSIMMIVILIAMFAIFYFMIIRPQKKQQQKAQERISALKPGDKVITIGGFYATIEKVLDDSFMIRLADNTVVRIARQGIAYPQQDAPAAPAAPAENKDDAPKSQSPIEGE
jgi:preprotein translocase subunit YajC